MPIDSTARWLVAVAHLIWEVLLIPDAFDRVFSGKRAKRGRLASGRAHLRKFGVSFEPHAIACGTKRVPVSWGWSFAKDALLVQL